MATRNRPLLPSLYFSVPGSGEGLFTTKKIPKATLVAHLSMFSYKTGEQFDKFWAQCEGNPEKSEKYRQSCAKYHFSFLTRHAIFGLPPGNDTGIFPNLGPKANHDFARNNAIFSEMEHPRWGILAGIFSNRFIEAGEEIFVNYGYQENPRSLKLFPWYFEAKARYEQEMNDAKLKTEL